MNTRLHQIDQLRGIAACGIMVFHFVSFQFGELPAESILGRIGLYGVSLFYVISGIALSHVYGPMLKTRSFPYRSFFLKRYFRLMPLFILATLVAIALSKKQFFPLQIGLNLTGLFALFQYDGGIATGSWSIGNEWVFYLIFPFILAAWSHKSNIWSRLIIMVTLAFWCVFAFHTSHSLANFWIHYIHPFNHLIFFLAGCAMGYQRLHLRPIDWKIPILGILALLVFCILPVYGDRIELVSGWTRLLLSACTICIALAWYRINIRFWNPLELTLFRIGDWSYSIYMLHPIVWALFVGTLKWLQWSWNPMLVIGAAACICIVLSGFVFHWVEKPIMQWSQGRILSKSNTK
jgi:exopolysaccharide production protein ExoZ